MPDDPFEGLTIPLADVPTGWKFTMPGGMVVHVSEMIPPGYYGIRKGGMLEIHRIPELNPTLE